MLIADNADYVNLNMGENTLFCFIITQLSKYILIYRRFFCRFNIGIKIAIFAFERTLLARFGHVKTSFAAALTLC